MAQSRTESRRGDDLSYRAQFNYTADRYGLALDRLVVEQNFNPEVGFLRRENFRRNFAQARFSPRTTNNRVVRQVDLSGQPRLHHRQRQPPESRELTGMFRTDFHNGDIASASSTRDSTSSCPRRSRFPGRAHSGRAATASTTRSVAYTAGQQHRVSGIELGRDRQLLRRRQEDGDVHAAASRSRSQLGVEPNISLNWIDLPQGEFTTTVVGGRATFTMTPRMFVAALVQYSSSNTSLSTNLRFRWEYQPGSELFVVYTEGRSTLPPTGTEPPEPRVRRQDQSPVPLLMVELAVGGQSALRGESRRPGTSNAARRHAHIVAWSLVFPRVLDEPGHRGAGSGSGGDQGSASAPRPMRIDAPIRIDGILDDPAWQGTAPATDFYQQQPAEFSPATRRTEVRFAYDETRSISAPMLYDDPDQLITNDLRRDFNGSDDRCSASSSIRFRTGATPTAS